MHLRVGHEWGAGSGAGLLSCNTFINDPGRSGSGSNEICLALNQEVWMVQGRAGVSSVALEGLLQQDLWAQNGQGRFMSDKGSP